MKGRKHMASLFRPSYTKVDPVTGRKVRRKSRKWYVKFRDADGIIRRRPGYTDKEATRALATELERKAARLKEGLSDPFEAHHKRPLAEHANHFEKHLSAKGDSPRYVKLKANQIRSLIGGCKF